MHGERAVVVSCDLVLGVSAVVAVWHMGQQALRADHLNVLKLGIVN